MTDTLSKIIAETLSSGVEPIGRKYFGIYDGYGDVPIAYFTKAEVFTALSGIVRDYEKAIDKNEVGKRFSLSCIENAVRALTELKKKDKPVSFISASVTTSFMSGDVLKDLETVSMGEIERSNVCLTFTEKAMTDGGDDFIKGVADARGMGFSTAVCDFNGEQSLSLLMDSPVDYVFLSPEFTSLSENRNKHGVFTSFTGLMRSLRISAILCGVKTDDVIREATASECFGIMPSVDYSGQFSFRKGGRELKDILSDGESAL